MKRFACILALIATLIPAVLFAQGKKSNFNIDSGNLALQGYDPVAYFNQQKAVEGKVSITTEHAGILYRFSSEANKNLFRSSPVEYLPQYGGWCAYAMGIKGEKVEVDPETFKIIEGKLYLFYNRFFNNTLDSWNKNESALKVAADKNWQKLTAK